MKKLLQFLIGGCGLFTFLGVLVTCQSLLAGGVGPSFMFYYPTPDVWTNSSVVDMYFIAPTRSTDVEQPLIYLTTTARSQKGCEAVILYGSNGEGGFGAFDWSGPGWAKIKLLQTELSQYLTNRPDQFCITRQMLHLRNGTYYLGLTNGFYKFLNNIELFDFRRGDWDVFYSNYFGTTNAAEAFSWIGDFGGWCPMVEMFGEYTNEPYPIGCDLAREFYDGKRVWQELDTVYPQNMAPVGEVSGANWKTLTMAPCTHFSVSVGGTNQVGGAYPMGSLCVTANTNAAGFTLSTTNGIIDPYWVSWPDSKWWDKTVVGLPPGYYRITFTPVPGVSTPPEQIFQIRTNMVTTVQAIYGNNAPNLPVVLLSSPLDNQTLWGTSFSATAQVAAGTAPYTVTFYTNAPGKPFAPAGVATSEPYAVPLGALASGPYGIYATVTDSTTPVPVTTSSETNTFFISIRWTNSAVSGNWSDPLSWDSGAVPASGAIVTFGTGGSTGVVDTVSRAVSSILFNRAANFAIGASGGAGLSISNGITVNNDFTYTISPPVTLGAWNNWTVNGNGTLEAKGAIASMALLTKSGSGTLALYANNSLSGGVVLNSGSLLLASGSALGTGPLTINSGSISSTSAHLSMPNNNPIVLNGTFTWTGAGGYNWNMGSGAVTLNTNLLIYVGNTLTIGGSITGAGGLNALDIAFQNMVGATYGVQLQAPITLRGNQTITGSGAVFNGVISDSGHGYGLTVAVKDVWGGWGGKVTLNAANTYSGDTTISNGSLIIGNNLALRYSALNAGSNSASLSVTAPTIGGLKGSTDLTGVFTSGYSAVTALTLNPQSGVCTYSGAIANGASGMTLTKSGAGTQVLAGTNTYSGATTINNGTLLVNGTLGAGAVTVASGATFGGNCVIGGPVTVNGTLVPGNPVGTLTVNNNLTCAGSSIWAYHLGGSSDLTAVNGNLTLGGTLNIADAGGFTTNTYTLFTYTGRLATNNISIGSTPNPNYTYAISTNTPGQVKLIVSYQGPPLTPTTTVLTSSANPSTNGQSVVFTATLRANGVTAADASGNFVFVVDGVPVASRALVGGSASFTNSPFSEGGHPILASYVGDARYASSMASLIQNCGTPIAPIYSRRTDGYTVATFTIGSGIWVVPDGVSSVEVLVVGGGGGSTASFSSGSGAGGMSYTANYPVTPGRSAQVEVGAGGVGTDGAPSVFDKVIAYGGTPGLGYTDGGDQGGYSTDGGLTIIPGNPGYHYSPMDGNWCSGGGAGHAGYKGDIQLGGEGAACSITGSEVYYAGGGGAPSSYASSGGTGYNLGFGGSGPVVFQGPGIPGAPNTGGGGGGGWGGGGGAGGSGVVIVAFRVSPTPPVIPPKGFVINVDGKPQITLPESRVGLQYRALYTERLENPVSASIWIPFGSPCVDPPNCWLNGTGGPLTWIDETGTINPQRFYIIQVR